MKLRVKFNEHQLTRRSEWKRRKKKNYVLGIFSGYFGVSGNPTFGLSSVVRVLSIQWTNHTKCFQWHKLIGNILMKHSFDHSEQKSCNNNDCFGDPLVINWPFIANTKLRNKSVILFLSPPHLFNTQFHPNLTRGQLNIFNCFHYIAHVHSQNK